MTFWHVLAGSYLNKHFHILKDPKPWNGSAMIVRALLTTCTRQFVKSVVRMGTKLGLWVFWDCVLNIKPALEFKETGINRLMKPVQRF